MSRRLLIGALLLASQPVLPQVSIGGKGINPQGTGSQSYTSYGPPVVADIAAIVIANADGYQRKHVITEGQVSSLIGAQGEYLVLSNSGASLLIIPGREFDSSQFRRVGGARTEVRGIVRLLRTKQYVGGVDLDLLEDPLLPPMPSPRADPTWPRISITVLALRDRTSPTFRSSENRSGSARRILDDPSSYVGKKARILGQFRGRNLFGDLPAESRRGKGDWVLWDGDTAMWVVGRAPKGDGFRLDLDYRGDTKKWLEVVGKPEIVHGIVYLKASKVLLSKPPAPEKPDQDRR